MLIGQLTGGAGNTTSFANTKQIFQYIQVGSALTALVIQRFVVRITGVPTINIIGQNFVQAFAEIMGAMLLGADSVKSALLPIANGSKGNEQTTYELENAGATTPNVYGFGTDKFSKPVVALMDAIQDKSNGFYSDMDFLVIDTTNLDQCTVTFPSGWTEEMDAVQLRALATTQFSALDTDGQLGGLLVLDMNQLKSVKLSANGGAIDLLKIQFP